jgi:hypothetical protein
MVAYSFVVQRRTSWNPRRCWIALAGDERLGERAAVAAGRQLTITNRNRSAVAALAVNDGSDAGLGDQRPAMVEPTARATLTLVEFSAAADETWWRGMRSGSSD